MVKPRTRMGKKTAISLIDDCFQVFDRLTRKDLEILTGASGTQVRVQVALLVFQRHLYHSGYHVTGSPKPMQEFSRNPNYPHEAPPQKPFRPWTTSESRRKAAIATVKRKEKVISNA